MMKRRFRPTTDTGQEDDEQQDSVDHFPVGGDRDEAPGNPDNLSSLSPSEQRARLWGPNACKLYLQQKYKNCEMGQRNCLFFSQ